MMALLLRGPPRNLPVSGAAACFRYEFIVSQFSPEYKTKFAENIGAKAVFLLVFSTSGVAFVKQSTVMFLTHSVSALFLPAAGSTAR
jgi:hypothetical protein